MSERERLRRIEWWMGWVRVVGVVFALVEVGVVTQHFAEGYRTWAWIVTGVLAAGTLVLFVLARREWSLKQQRILSVCALAFDTAIVIAFVFVFSFEPGTQIRQTLTFPVVEAALRFGLLGGIGMPVVLLPALVVFEQFRSARFEPREFIVDNITFPFGLNLILGLIVGFLVRSLGKQTDVAEERAVEAERLRDALGRQVDVLDATNRVARALGSSLELDEAFSAFIRELRGLVPFDRMAIVLQEGNALRVMASAGIGADEVMPAGAKLEQTPLAMEIVTSGQTVYRRNLAADRLPEEDPFVTG